MTDPIVLRVDNDLADQIVTVWLKQHMEWMLDAYDNAHCEEDKIEACADFLSMHRVHQYVSGDLDDGQREKVSELQKGAIARANRKSEA